MSGLDSLLLSISSSAVNETCKSKSKWDESKATKRVECRHVSAQNTRLSNKKCGREDMNWAVIQHSSAQVHFVFIRICIQLWLQWMDGCPFVSEDFAVTTAAVYLYCV